MTMSATAKECISKNAQVTCMSAVDTLKGLVLDHVDDRESAKAVRVIDYVGAVRQHHETFVDLLALCETTQLAEQLSEMFVDSVSAIVAQAREI
jgi:hypothetical protein